MTTMNAAALEAEFTRLSKSWQTLTRHHKGIALARLEELEGRAQDVAGEEHLIARIKHLRTEIKGSMRTDSPA